MVFRKNILVLFLAMGLLWGLLTQATAEGNKPYTIVRTAELKSILDHKPKNLLVIDARNSEEYEDVHIPGAINIPQRKFEQYAHLLPKQKTTMLIFYCNGVK